MPIINGQKMACAPCIRGHRSTKCNHYNERVMVPVRKPGRPLSTCPCPPGRPCACGGVRIAIPKRQKCHCPSGSPDAAADGSDEEPSPTDNAVSPTRPAFRVGKPSTGPKANSRKQSFAGNLERMDPRSLNIIASPNGSNGLNGITNGVNGASMVSVGEAPPAITAYGAPMAMMPPGTAGSFVPQPHPHFGPPPMAYSMGPPQYPAQIPMPPPNIKMENGGYTPPLNGNYGVAMPPARYTNGAQGNGHPSFHGPPQPANLGPSPMPKANGNVPAGGSCCGSKAQAPAPPIPAPVPTPQGYGASSGGGGCCGSKTQAPQPDLNNMPSPRENFGQTFAPQFSPAEMKMEDMNSFQFPTVFTYPAGFGSWQQPINPTIWQEVASRPTMHFANAISPAVKDSNVHGNLGNSHECTCGEGCQCVGCLAHPFNAQMFQYVSNAYNSHPNSANGSTNGGSPNVGPVTGSNLGELAAINGNHQLSLVLSGSESPAEAPTPSNESSPSGEEELLWTEDFLFVNLPIAGLCEGNIVSCPCGDDCNCVGCLVHNTPAM
ncbi:hypothetical protein QBC35DRAFT_376989 [Podospora australis]|uniref:Copper-fist domain-containing protein n=1 Tax=Podospora australis TaxID=1536484 RepID=A0AAN7ALS2_9PEZI|nr:hypothetical protein QBC35DRAFT_376989 [Podospora australis]